MSLTGYSIIGYGTGIGGGPTLHGVNPATGEALEPAYHAASLAEVDSACAMAATAYHSFRQTTGADRAAFLRTIADNIEALGDVLPERANLETALPLGRFQGERGRTCAQLRRFADVIDDGSWVRARIDHADPDRSPFPKPDVRTMLRPIGPVAVFGASNFPLAFSVGGGDTASALAAGCPVVANAHFAHPGTSELVGRAIRDAAQSCGLPEGVFSLVYGVGHEVGATLVRNPQIKAVGFTGSLKGGRALMDIAASRPEPIPVYAEMGSINPVFILPGALAERGEQLAAGLQGSVTLGAGQFCTNPGVVVVGAGTEADALISALGTLMNDGPAATMLTEGISNSYRDGLASFAAEADAVATPDIDRGPGNAQVSPAVFKTDVATFMSSDTLCEENFGPSTLIVTHSSTDEMLALAHDLEGHLTATIHGTDEDLANAAELLNILEQKVGRIVINGYPTGVEVCHSMIHGGPYPAGSDGRTTSVGTLAIERFARPVCYQGFGNAILPAELKDSNPLGIHRLVDGEWM
jgi:NADP-dependent aldehyde dehydrogenase